MSSIGHVGRVGAGIGAGFDFRVESPEVRALRVKAEAGDAQAQYELGTIIAPPGGLVVMQGREEGKETPAAAFSDPARDTSVLLQRMKEQDEDRRKLTTKLSAASGERLEFKVASPSEAPAKNEEHKSSAHLHSTTPLAAALNFWRSLWSEKSTAPVSAKAAITSTDLKKLFPKLQVLDEAVWETHVDLDAFGMSVKDAPPLDASTISTLKNLFDSSWIDSDAGITLLTLPRGLTLNKLVKLASSPKQGNAAKFVHICTDALRGLGDASVDETYRVVITNNVLKESRGLTVDRQLKLLTHIGCEMPETLPAATLAILTYVSSRAASPTRLYSEAPLTYTRCAEKSDRYHLAVGCSSVGFLVSLCPFTDESIGVGGMVRV